MRRVRLYLLGLRVVYSIFCFMYGLLCGFMWRSVRLGDITGVVLYPWCAFCILFWFGFNLLLWTQCSVLVIDAIALSGYELFLLTHPKHVSVCARGRADCQQMSGQLYKERVGLRV